MELHLGTFHMRLSDCKERPRALRQKDRRIKTAALETGTVKSTEDIRFPKAVIYAGFNCWDFYRNDGHLLVVSGIAARGRIWPRWIFLQDRGFQNWIIYAVIQGAQFSAAIYIILSGVRLVIAESYRRLRGLQKRIVPHARPAVDCPVLFSYAPNAAMIGFLMSFLGGIVTMLILIGINTWFGG